MELTRPLSINLMILLLTILTISMLISCIVIRKKGFPIGPFTIFGIFISCPWLIISMMGFALRKAWTVYVVLTLTVFLISSFVSLIINICRFIEATSRDSKYKEYALTDSMTGLGSRFAYEELMNSYQNTPIPDTLNMIFMDVDGLKTTNDTLGHAAGDEIIIGAATSIRDAFANKGHCFRMGGDEFLVVINADSDTVNYCIEKFKLNVKQWRGMYSEHLKVSCGVVSARDNKGLSIDDLVKKADHCMYMDKKQRKKQMQQNS